MYSCLQSLFHGKSHVDGSDEQSDDHIRNTSHSSTSTLSSMIKRRKSPRRTIRSYCHPMPIFKWSWNYNDHRTCNTTLIRSHITSLERKPSFFVILLIEYRQHVWFRGLFDLDTSNTPVFSFADDRERDRSLYSFPTAFELFRLPIMNHHSIQSTQLSDMRELSLCWRIRWCYADSYWVNDCIKREEALQ